MYVCMYVTELLHDPTNLMIQLPPVIPLEAVLRNQEGG